MLTIKKVILFSLVTIAIFGTLAVFQSNNNLNNGQTNQIHPQTIETEVVVETEITESNINEVTEIKRRTNPFSIRKTPKPLSILLFGVDRTPDEKYGRSDSIMLALVQPETKELMLMSIPRDTYINIPDHGYHKLNRSFQLGGPTLTKQTVSDWLEFEINETASIDYASFEKMIDLIGGIEMHVDRRMAHNEFIIEEGLQTLSGKEALYFVRFRKSLDGNHDSDYKRTERQRQLLTKLTSELLKSRSFTESFSLLRSLFKTVDTTLSLQQIITYGHHYSDFSSEKITTLSITGHGDRRGGLWYEIIPDKELEEKQKLIYEFMNPQGE
ncbi:LCP family protein [Anaerobacillus isosaccharinicus]|uniref:LCP family protein n=1 Tax=Anaerobacillus isosaccharinicus TaxID=1532552 RepID=A0A7S7L948_9BACI|nr:LCP family protein [Anaerobacillus isosaccharinicus]MBA5584952.1 LCP family protein [Anaerobacillus isosaccharinicus]QOY36692.1 LCP family protein [Anaerobacillus isosaccharinicus]